MTLVHIFVFAAVVLGHGILLGGRGRTWLMLGASTLALYWLQPATPVRQLDFWLPTASLALTVLVWAATQPNAARPLRPTLLTASAVTVLVLVVALNRYLEVCCITPSRPPQIVQVLLAVAGVWAAATLASRYGSGSPRWLALLVLGFAALFVALKADPLARGLSAGLRMITGQSVAQAAALDIRWLGFSYLAFRLIHALRERMLGRLPDLTLREFLIFAVFFPALTAGPIDRADRFVKDLRTPFALGPAPFVEGGWRMLWGIFKKFAVADTLALIALNGVNAAQTQSAAWTWVLLYAYAFRIYFDFSGYTDIAVGLARWLGVKLPENFDRPYFKQNLTAFWNSWHITLAQWFRAYYFNPLTRSLRARAISPAITIFLAQFSTMILIGLWHGVTWNFVAWGAWHGLGLFVHNRWADFTKPRAAMLDARPVLKLAAAWGGVLLTFHFTLLGWVWFALPEIGLAWRVMLALFGVGV